MSRPSVVKEIWKYVKANNLQDPSDKRYIICDEKLKPIFGEKVHMFTMNKVLCGFMYKPEEVTGGSAAKKEDAMVAKSSPAKSEVSDEDDDADGDGTSVAMSQTSSVMPGFKKEED